jgi:uncharacterized protein YpmB
MVRLCKAVFAVFFLLTSFSFAQSVTALASVDSSDYLVGDYINYSIEIISDKNVEITYPVITDSLKNVEIIKQSEPQTVETEDKKSTTFNYVISYYDSATVTIPPIPVHYKTPGDPSVKIALSNPVTFDVHTLKVQSEGDIADVKYPLTIPLDWKFILLIVLIILIILSVAFYFYKRYQKRKSELPVKKEIIRIPAHVRALTALDNLATEKLWQKGLIKDYHSKITGIIRGYFEERFKLPALELTTSEQMQQLMRARDAKVILDTTNEFLNNADLVKFAKFVPLDSVNEEMMKQARKIVENTIPKYQETVEVEEVQNV